MNNTTAASGFYTAIKGVPGDPGATYLRLVSQSDGRSVINGIAVSGILDSISQTPKSGFPFSQRPQSFTGNWEYMRYGPAPGSISALLTKWNSSLHKRDTIALAIDSLTGMVMSWASFTFDFVYRSGNFPDSCIIILKSSGAIPYQSDYLLVDNLAFSGSVVSISETANAILPLNIFPNPANNEVEISYSKNLSMGDKLVISDLLGNEIFNKTINGNSFKINTSNYANGTYIISLANSFNVKYSIGKFTIQH
jgi:hypothetical protein